MESSWFKKSIPNTKTIKKKQNSKL
ncbi:hypothetical protein Gohar_002601 [Gossypium harknessii]|uniref:Uncharacterized protein n=1 Tax=Gossypium harknessii TaxID=34285 RepID=A0A7J9HLA1_9ROSI|nr:hypothetical protein [Gossypium harknessii]